MSKIHTLEQTLLDVKALLKYLDEKKALNPIVINVSEHTAFTDAFVIASGQSYIHLQSLSHYIKDFLEPLGYKKINPHNPISENPWILLDFTDIVVHLFTPEAREFYNLEKLWFDTPKITLENMEYSDESF